MTIIHSSKHRNCVLLVLEEHETIDSENSEQTNEDEEEERPSRPQKTSPKLMILKLSFTG